MKGYRIHFIRHGITSANLNGEYIGITDEPLCDEGIKEIKSKIDTYEYPKVQKVYSSPLRRCTETADLIYPDCFRVIVPELCEMNFGDFEGKKAVDLMGKDEYKQFIKGGLDNPAPNGESMRSVVERCFKAITSIIDDMMKEGMTNCAVVTHGGIIMNILSCFGLPKLSPMEFSCDFGEGYEILVTAQMWQRSNAFEIMGRFPYEKVNDEE